MLVIGGFGSGKTRFFLKPNLMQCHSSYVITDQRGLWSLNAGNCSNKEGYRIKIFNTINFKRA